MVINGKDGSIGLNGKDGANGLTIKGGDGKPGVDGTNITRLIIEERMVINMTSLPWMMGLSSQEIPVP